MAKTRLHPRRADSSPAPFPRGMERRTPIEIMLRRRGGRAPRMSQAVSQRRNTLRAFRQRTGGSLARSRIAAGRCGGGRVSSALADAIEQARPRRDLGGSSPFAGLRRRHAHTVDVVAQSVAATAPA